MAGCSCCLVHGSQVIVGDLNVSKYTINVSVDSTREVMSEPLSTEECLPDPDGNYMHMYGPGRSTMQLTAYPFSNEAEEYTLGFYCPINVSVQIPWRWVFDCRQCTDCLDPLTGQVAGKVRGQWIGIPMKKKTVVVTGETESDLFTFAGCPTAAAKFNIQAGPQSVMIPQVTTQYSEMEYHGLPIPFNTEGADKIWDLTVTTNSNCDYATGFSDVKAYLTGFTFSFEPPAAPTVTYNLDAIVNYCPEC